MRLLFLKVTYFVSNIIVWNRKWQYTGNLTSKFILSPRMITFGKNICGCDQTTLYINSSFTYKSISYKHLSYKTIFRETILWQQSMTELLQLLSYVPENSNIDHTKKYSIFSPWKLTEIPKSLSVWRCPQMPEKTLNQVPAIFVKSLVSKICHVKKNILWSNAKQWLPTHMYTHREYFLSLNCLPEWTELLPHSKS
jgi:hypothetical protein